jgi:FHS family L-fucose permease-like MFS transporter
MPGIESKPVFVDRRNVVVFVFVVSLFMLWGVAITMGDVLNKHFQNVLHISKSSSGLIQLSIFGAYAVMGIPAGLFMRRFGYKYGVILGLSLYAFGAFLFLPASNMASFPFFRIALFILACGLATLEAVSHPFIAALGDEQTSDQRMNFAQAFNSLGGVIGPLIGSYFFFSNNQAQSSDLVAVKQLYFAIGIIIVAIAVAFSFLKVKINCRAEAASIDNYVVAESGIVRKKLIHQKHFVFAVIAQLFNVAAQGGTWAYFINYGHEVMHLSDKSAAHFFSLSIFLMMIGRFAGTFLMRYIKPNLLLSIFASANIVMCIIVAQANGWVSFTALILINFFFSIMFPTIFSLGIKDLGRDKQQASSFIVMGVVGGAIFPPLMGLIANSSVSNAYYLPIICYAVVAAFGISYKYLKPNNLVVRKTSENKSYIRLPQE